MSVMPWGTMNSWLRIETEQRGAWQRVRAQDLRAVQVAKRQAPEQLRPRTSRASAAMPGCPEAA